MPQVLHFFINVRLKEYSICPCTGIVQQKGIPKAIYFVKKIMKSNNLKGGVWSSGFSQTEILEVRGINGYFWDN